MLFNTVNYLNCGPFKANYGESALQGMVVSGCAKWDINKYQNVLMGVQLSKECVRMWEKWRYILGIGQCTKRIIKFVKEDNMLVQV